jgi:type IV pilus assembly protein PilN
MRIDINLASRPYEDARQFWMRWGVGVGLLGLLTVALVGLAVHGWIDAGRDRQTIRGLERQIEERDSERAKAQAFLDLPANRSTRDQSQFLNAMIERKGFSWTRVFEDLEQVMPSDLHVASLLPEMNDQNQMMLKIDVAGDNRAGALELVHRMEQSRHFQGTQLIQEHVGSESGGGTVAAEIVAAYIPDQPSRSAK